MEKGKSIEKEIFGKRKEIFEKKRQKHPPGRKGAFRAGELKKCMSLQQLLPSAVCRSHGAVIRVICRVFFFFSKFVGIPHKAVL